MTTGLFVIAVEDYPNSKEMPPVLPGVVSIAEKFAQWMVTNFGVASEYIVFCSSRESEYQTNGTTRDEIKNAVKKLLSADIADNVDRLVMLLSGHGIMVPGDKVKEEHQEILLCSDYVSSGESGDACLPINQLSRLLARGMGTGTHLMFVDACRTVNHDIDFTGLGLEPKKHPSGTADTYRLSSAAAGDYAPNDGKFVERLLAKLEGDEVELRESVEGDGVFAVTFTNVASAMREAFAAEHRGMETRVQAEKSDVVVRHVNHAGPTATIVGPDRQKAPPIALFVEYDNAFLIGATNGQLRSFIDDAFEIRDQRPWKRLEVFSLEDLADAGRPGVDLADLTAERDSAETYLKDNASKLAESVMLYRYGYADTFGSLWIADNGRRRAHASSRIAGQDIRLSPAMDFIDFPEDRHPQIDFYFQLLEAVKAKDDTQLKFSYPPGAE